MLLSQWADSYWVISTVRPKTLFDYKGIYRRVLEPTLGNLQLDEITPMDIQKIVNKETPHNGRHALMILKSLYREANLHQISEKNPTKGVKQKTLPEPKREFLTWEQVDVKDWGKYNDQIRFLALHGLRWSEAVVLQEEDIHDGYVHINKSVYGLPKSHASNRRVPYIGHFKIFPKTYKAMLTASHKHGVSVHSFRRTYAYLLKSQGVHVTTAQKLLGHSDPLVTLKIYTSVLDDESDQVGELLRALR